MTSQKRTETTPTHKQYEVLSKISSGQNLENSQYQIRGASRLQLERKRLSEIRVQQSDSDIINQLAIELQQIQQVRQTKVQKLQNYDNQLASLIKELIDKTRYLDSELLKARQMLKEKDRKIEKLEKKIEVYEPKTDYDDQLKSKFMESNYLPMSRQKKKLMITQETEQYQSSSTIFSKSGEQSYKFFGRSSLGNNMFLNSPQQRYQGQSKNSRDQ